MITSLSLTLPGNFSSGPPPVNFLDNALLSAPYWSYIPLLGISALAIILIVWLKIKQRK